MTIYISRINLPLPSFVLKRIFHCCLNLLDLYAGIVYDDNVANVEPHIYAVSVLVLKVDALICPSTSKPYQ